MNLPGRIAADDDHDHLHGERNQRPKTFAALDGQIARGFVQGDAGEKNKDNAEQGEDERVGKPAFAPSGEGQAVTRQSPFVPRDFPSSINLRAIQG